jgi:hypothetical protein
MDIPRGSKGRLAKSEQTRAGLDAETLEDLGETGKSGGRRPTGGRGSRDGGSRDGGRGGRYGGARDGGSRDGGSRDGGSRDGGRGRGAESRTSTPAPRAENGEAPARNRSRRRTRGGKPAGSTD